MDLFAQSSQLEHGALETACDAIVLQSERVLLNSNKIAALAKTAKAAGTAGACKEFHKIAAELQTAGGAMAGETASLVAILSRDVAPLLGRSYIEELATAIRKAGIPASKRESRIIAFPRVVTFNSKDMTVSIGKKKEKGIRPSKVVAALRIAREEAGKTKLAPFKLALHRAYEIALRIAGRHPDAVVPLSEIYELLTLNSGIVEYTPDDFAVDIVLLDSTGTEQESTSGKRIYFHGSTGTKGGRTFEGVLPNGETKVYYGVAFR